MLPFIKPYSFEWDETKNSANQIKHGVSFEEAAHVFSDSKRCIFTDEKHTTDTEQRYYCLGKINDEVCSVRYVIRNNKIRIIGAGYWRKEKLIYEKINAK